ncbi:YciI family protein [bacterium]|nr:YciI family protein [bacterium]
MKYALLIHESEEVFAVRQDPAKAPAYWGAYTAFGQALTEAGVMTGGAGLQPPATATSLRKVQGKNAIQDGPFADTKEQLAGFYLIEVVDLDAAMEWAERCPAIEYGGSVEVRPLLVM